MIQVNNLSFRYEDETNPDRFALRDVTFDIREGEFVAIIGHNGSGKSTLSKLLNGIFQPTGGSIHIGGIDTKDPERIWDVRKTAGMVFQNPDNQLVATVVEEDVAFGPENLGLPSEEIRRRVDEALASVGMSAYKRKSPHHLSGGQKQRVAIAGILAMQPRCIIFDESTAMLDPLGRREVMETIHRLNRSGMTVLLVTHYMDEAVQADRVLVMDSGEIVMRGAPREVFTQVSRLQALGLDVPQVTRIAQRLRAHDVAIEDCLTVRDLTEQIRTKCTHRTPPAPTAQAEPTAQAAPTAPESAEAGDAAIIRISGLSHRYNRGTPNETAALESIHLEIAHGELVGLIGHTGSGKSTLIQQLNGLIVPTSGRIVVSGYDITEYVTELSKRPTRKELAVRRARLLEVRRRVGLVFQYPEYQLFEESVEKDVAFGPQNLGLPTEEVARRVRAAMETVGLDYDALKDRSPFELSGGQRRRVAIAGVLAMEPDVLILDEPTAGLDPKGRDELLAEIRRLHDTQGKTIIIVSHSMEDMARLAERLIVMNRGAVVLDGAPRDVFANATYLEEIGLGVPEVTRVMRALADLGLDVDRTILCPDAAADAIEKAVVC